MDENDKQAEPVARPDDDKVICPACTHQFRAIPCNVQKMMIDAGFEPPFTHPAQPVQPAEPLEMVTDLEMLDMYCEPNSDKEMFEFGRAVQKRFMEKNGLKDEPN